MLFILYCCLCLTTYLLYVCMYVCMHTQVSGPSEDPLLTCFLPNPQTRTRALADLYEIIIRNDRGKTCLSCAYMLICCNNTVYGDHCIVCGNYYNFTILSCLSVYCISDHYTLLRPIAHTQGKIKVSSIRLLLIYALQHSYHM